MDAVCIMATMTLVTCIGTTMPAADMLTVVDVAAIAERAAIAGSMCGDDSAGMIHETCSVVLAALIEVARSPGVVPAIGHVAAAGVTSDGARPIAVRLEVGDESLEPAGERRRNSDRSGRGRDGNDVSTSGRNNARRIAAVKMPSFIGVSLWVVGGAGRVAVRLKRSSQAGGYDSAL